MDTKVGPIGGFFRPREAEGADTRYGLLHQEPLRYGGGRKGRRETPSEGLDEDQATVSVEALLLFLESFLSRHFGLSAEEGGVEKPSESSGQRGAAHIEALRLKAAQAARAYEHAADVSQKVAWRNRAQDADPETSKGAGELEIVIDLIRDLRALSLRDVDALQIERGANFVESLASAVLKAKQEMPV